MLPHFGIYLSVSFGRVPNNLVLRQPKGEFIVVHSNRTIAKAPYWGDAGRNYVAWMTTYQEFITVGTLILMIGIALMSSRTWEKQVILGALYLGLNGIYMPCTLKPVTGGLWHWILRLIEILKKNTV